MNLRMLSTNGLSWKINLNWLYLLLMWRRKYFLFILNPKIIIKVPYSCGFADIWRDKILPFVHGRVPVWLKRLLCNLCVEILLNVWWLPTVIVLMIHVILSRWMWQQCTRIDLRIVQFIGSEKKRCLLWLATWRLIDLCWPYPPQLMELSCPCLLFSKKTLEKKERSSCLTRCHSVSCLMCKEKRRWMIVQCAYGTIKWINRT